jgi:hypothetical protein
VNQSTAPRILNRASLGLGVRARTFSISKLRRHTRARAPLPEPVAPAAGIEPEPEPEPEPAPEVAVERPRTRGDCADGPRPCPWVSCKHHLYLDVTKHGSLKFNFPDREIDELRETCALDVAAGGPRHLVTVGELMNITRERVRQIERRALERARSDETGALSDASDLLDDGEELPDETDESVGALADEDGEP